LLIFVCAVYLYLVALVFNTAPAGSAPSFIGKPVIRQAGGKIIFECKLKGEPFPTIVWQHGETSLQESVRFKKTHTVDADKVHTIGLEISEFQQQDSGQYKVFAKSQFGEASAVLNLNIEGIMFNISPLSSNICLFHTC